MANRTVKDAKTIKGTNPQYLVEKIIRSRIYECKFWKEQCFALTAELLVDKGMELKYVGGVYGGNIKPSPFLCLVLKMLQIQPEKDIIIEFIRNDDFKYLRALGAYYLRLTGTSVDCYKYLEPLYNDYRKLRRINREGAYELIHMDEFIDELLREDRVCDVILPRIQKRDVLVETNELEVRISPLEDDMEDIDSDEELDEDVKKKENERSQSNRHRKESDRFGPSSRIRRSSRSRSRERITDHRSDRHRDERHHRDRERDAKDKRRRSSSRDKDRVRERDRKEIGGEKDKKERKEKDDRKDRREADPSEERGDKKKKKRKEKDRERDGKTEDQKKSKSSRRKPDDDIVEIDPEIAEANALRASLGLAPLK